MTVDFLRHNWALVVAAALLLIIGVTTLVVLYRRSAAGQLSRTAKRAQQAHNNLAKAQKAVAAAEKRVSRLQKKAASVKPRVLQEAKEALQDAQALQKIAGDQILVANNHLRRVIYEEYPPARHEALRRKYLPDDKPDTKPFSF